MPRGLVLALWVCLPWAVATTRRARIVVDVDRPARTIRSHDHFTCVTLDWWPNSKVSPNPTSPYPWTNASVLNVDLSHPTLESAVAALGPSVRLRVGGTLADQIFYDVDGSASGDCTEPPVNASASDGFGPGCLSMHRWDTVNQFAARAGAELVFGLNVLIGRTPAPNTTVRLPPDPIAPITDGQQT